MTWQKYYDVAQINFDDRLKYLKNHGKWVIVFNRDSEKPGYVAYQRYYRTEALAIKGAKRLHHRLHGEFEKAILGE